ncbi:MAG: beta-phosphoglucomutase [Clostridiales bacterium 38-18]|nr:MAG: beta-phosphoglucomutase [Clostridiales bacterium 38-18]
MIEAVIFDLDGVLVSTDHLHYKAWKQLAEELEIKDFNEVDNHRQRGVSRMASLEVVLEKAIIKYTDTEKVAFADRKNDYYVNSLVDITEKDLLPGALETLMALKSKGIKIALGSASKNAALILEKTCITQYFDALATGHDTTRSKPDPQVFQVAADKLGVSYESCIVVEDASAGLQAAKAANMKTVGVGPAALSPLADWKAENLASKSLRWDEMLNINFESSLKR